MSGPGYSLGIAPRIVQKPVLSMQMRHSLAMLQMTSMELRAELQHQMEQNPVIEDVSTPREKILSSDFPDERSSGAVTENGELAVSSPITALAKLT